MQEFHNPRILVCFDPVQPVIAFHFQSVDPHFGGGRDGEYGTVRGAEEKKVWAISCDLRSREYAEKGFCHKAPGRKKIGSH